MTIAATPRTGHQYTITHGDYVAVITELGAALRKLTYQGKNVIATFGANEVAPASSGQLLIPYPNRIEDGVYTFEGKTYELPIDEHDTGRWRTSTSPLSRSPGACRTWPATRSTWWWPSPTR